MVTVFPSRVSRRGNTRDVSEKTLVSIIGCWFPSDIAHTLVKRRDKSKHLTFRDFC